MCSDIDSVQITVLQSDIAEFAYVDSLFCIPVEDPTPMVTGTSGGTFSIDNFGIIDDSTGEINLDNSSIGDYAITYITSSATCPDTAIRIIEICEEIVLIIPKVFSPNSDNINDIFSVSGDNIANVDAQIFNRWGEMIMEWNTPKGFWDGRTSAGKEAPNGTYFYLIKIVDTEGHEFGEQGSLTLIR